MTKDKKKNMFHCPFSIKNSDKKAEKPKENKKIVEEVAKEKITNDDGKTNNSPPETDEIRKIKLPHNKPKPSEPAIESKTSSSDSEPIPLTTKTFTYTHNPKPEPTPEVPKVKPVAINPGPTQPPPKGTLFMIR